MCTSNNKLFTSNLCGLSGHFFRNSTFNRPTVYVVIGPSTHYKQQTWDKRNMYLTSFYQTNLCRSHLRFKIHLNPTLPSNVEENLIFNILVGILQTELYRTTEILYICQFFVYLSFQ